MFRTVPLSFIICWQLADSKPVWHMPLLCVQWKTPDDGQRNCPKHVDFYSKNKFEKLVHLFGFITRILLRYFYLLICLFIYLFFRSFNHLLTIAGFFFRECYRLGVVQFVTLIGWTYLRLTGVLVVCFKVDQLHGLIVRTVKTSKESNQNYNLNFNQLNLKFQGVWVLYSPRISVSQNIRRFRWQNDTWKMKCSMLGGSIQEVNLNVYSGWHGICALYR